jgi:glycerol-3-phosphate dehydrogenase subunit B
MIFDCVVIGAGLAGMTAGVRLAESGARVAVIAKGVGSLHLGGATIDVLGYAPEPVDSPKADWDRFVATNPQHPYAHVGLDVVSDSIVWLKEHLPEIGLTGDLDGNMRLPTAVGTAKPSAVVPRSMVAGDLRAGGTYVIVGLESLKDFFPAYCADNITAAPVSNGGGIRARAISVAPPLTGEADVSALGLARQLENPELRKELIRTIANRLEPGESVGLPAVLGVDQAATVWNEMSEGLGTGVFEIPTLPPSVPGIRAFRKLRSLLRSAGGRLVVGPEAVGFETEGGKVTALKVNTSTRVVEYRAREYLLASGGVSAGGIMMGSDWRFIEPVFGLPVALAPEPGNERWQPDYFSPQPTARAGVAVDDSLRPIDSEGNVVYENVRVAGATIAAAEPWREKSGNGIALATGFAAASEILASGNGGG